MSILLCTYWTDGIVFSADRNATVAYETEEGEAQYVETGSFTKVLAWPTSRALAGFVGLGELADLRMDEWMRQFIAKTRDFDSIDTLAGDLRDLIQDDFDDDYPDGADVRRRGAIVRLGGFRRHEDIFVPVNYVITNIPNIPGLRSGVYPYATSRFTMTDQIHWSMNAWGVEYPTGVRDKIIEIEQRGDLLWINNGYMHPAFNAFKGALWHTLKVLRREAMLSPDVTMKDRIAYSEMSVRVFGLFFEHHLLPHERAVGGGADTGWIPWPE